MSDLSKSSGQSPGSPKTFLLMLKFINSGDLKITSSERRFLSVYASNASFYTPTITQLSNELRMFKGNVSRTAKSLLVKKLIYIGSYKSLCAGRKTPVYKFHPNFWESFNIWKNNMRSSYQSNKHSYQLKHSEVITTDKEEYTNITKEDFSEDDEMIWQFASFLKKGEIK